jgi:hypothetical protein
MHSLANIDHEIKKDKMRGACSTHGRYDKFLQNISLKV